MDFQEQQNEYEKFRELYEKQHPGSVPEKPQHVSPFPRFLPEAVFIVFVCAALVSGVHTVPIIDRGIPDSFLPFEFRRIAAMAGFVMVEGVILLSAFLLAVKESKRLAQIVLLSASLAAIISNLYSVQEAFSLGQSIMESGVTIIIGVVAPITALASGEIYVLLRRYARKDQREASEIYQKARQDFDQKVNSAWSKVTKGQKSAVGQSRTVPIDPDSPGLLQPVMGFARPGLSRTDPDYGDSPGGRGTQTMSLDKAIELLQNNPDAMDLTSRGMSIHFTGEDRAYKTFQRAKRQIEEDQ